MLGIDRPIQQETLTAVDVFAFYTLRMIREISAYDCPSFFREPLPLLLRDLRNLIATLIATANSLFFCEEPRPIEVHGCVNQSALCNA